MPRKTSSRKKNSYNKTDTVSVHARLYTEANFASGTATIAMNPASFPQALEIADVYAMYRIKKLRYRLYRSTTNATTQVAVFVPGVTDNGPGTISVAALIPHCAILPLSATVPTPWKNVPPAILKSYMPWFKTILGSPDPAEETQGNIFLRGNTTDQYAIEIDAIFEFREPLSTSVTPAERGRLECEAERVRLLRILASTTSQPAAVTK